MASQIACQLYTLRDFTKTPADIAKTFARVKKIGYEAVQVSALGPIDPKELTTILKNEGLTVCATHFGFDVLRDKKQEVIDNHKLWGCEYTAIGGFGFAASTTTEDWFNFARDFSALAKQYEGSGISIGYHNHSHELVKIDGKTILDHLIEKLSRDVWIEIDVYWITHGGGDPAAWIEKVAGRIPCVHLKDLGVTTDRKQLIREVGEGNLNFPRIIETARKAGTKWFIVEQDDCNGQDPFQCIETSLRNLNELGLS
ncbi:MAG TPA: sugar phosphate isomerase/epimerase [Tepidisphaeraceae bacterium]